MILIEFPKIITGFTLASKYLLVLLALLLRSIGIILLNYSSKSSVILIVKLLGLKELLINLNQLTTLSIKRLIFITTN